MEKDSCHQNWGEGNEKPTLLYFERNNGNLRIKRRICRKPISHISYSMKEYCESKTKEKAIGNNFISNSKFLDLLRGQGIWKILQKLGSGESRYRLCAEARINSEIRTMEKGM